MVQMRNFLYISLFCVLSTASVRPATDPVKLLEMFLNAGGQSASLSPWNPSGFVQTLKDLDFKKTGRFALSMPLLPVALVFDIGGPGAGSMFFPLPPAHNLYFDWDTALIDTPAAQARLALLKLGQEKLFGAIARGEFSSDEDRVAVDFFGGDGEASKKHWIERVFDFKVTPEVVWLIKVMLLMKYAVEHVPNEYSSASDKLLQSMGLLVDFGVLTMRLFRAWRRDSRAVGGISAAIKDKSPWLAEALSKISEKVFNDPARIMKMLDKMWRVIADGEGIIFGADGSVQRGLGFSVTGCACRSETEAARLCAFLNQKQINWDVLETQTMVGKSFLVRTALLVESFGKQLAQLPEGQRIVAGERFKGIEDTIRYLIASEGEEDFGRYDIDPANNEDAAPQVKAAFLHLVGPDKPISSSASMPCVVQSGKYVYYCSNEVGLADAGKLLAILFFRIAWRYMEVLRGSTSEGAEAVAKVHEQEQRHNSASFYLTCPEGAFLVLPLGALSFKADDVRALAAQYTKNPKESEELAAQLMQGAAQNYARVYGRVIDEIKGVITDLGKYESPVKEQLATLASKFSPVKTF